MKIPIEIIRKGGLVVAPSDTVYGLLCDATNDIAVKKLIEFKERPAGHAISVFVSDFEMMKEYVEVDVKRSEILRQILPGPFTVVLKSRHRTSALLESEDGALGVRIPQYKPIIDLVKAFGKPVTATSANLSGRSPIHSISVLMKTLSAKKKSLIDLIIDAGKLPKNKPSTVLDLTESKIKTLREGDLRFTNKKIYESKSEQETKKIAQNILKSYISNRKSKPLIFILQGNLGVGKTVFVKGIGEELGVKDIISPTFVIYYEYNFSIYQYIKKLVHVDLYKLESAEEFKQLGLEKYLKPGNIFCIEWGEKSEPIIDLLKDKGEIIYVDMKYVDENKREIEVNF